MKSKAPILFVFAGVLALLLGVTFGLLASLQYIFPDFIKDLIPFNEMRPFHTTTVISWIILTATGCIYFYISRIEKLTLFSSNLPKVHFAIFILTGVGIYLSFLLGKTGGREYLSYAPILTIPILLGWVLFGVNYFKTIRKHVSNWPVYYWMWGTGIVFMIYHLCEAHLWVLPSFRAHVVKDIAVQWKSYGSFVGSWNMLVYGIAIYVMSKIKKSEDSARGRKVFFFYFLGLTNLMFGWAHHTYVLPTLPWIRYVAYAVSMTEWIILAHIIYSWKKSLTSQEKTENSKAFMFLNAADFWVFFNIIFALLISIPAINIFTHGTHITVAHSMGTTIGINTSILLGAVFYLVSQLKIEQVKFTSFKKVYYLLNGALLLFFLTLIYAGVVRADWVHLTENVLFSQMQDSLYYTYILFFLFGLVMVVAIVMLSRVMLMSLWRELRAGKD